METDREVLIWLHERLVKVHGEKELYDYMHRLRAIIANTPAKRKTPTEVLNGIDDLYRKLKIKPNAVLTGAGQEPTGNGAPSHRVRLKT